MKNMPTKAPNYLNRLAALLVFLSMLLVSSANAQEDLFSNAPYVSHWETVDGVARYGYWHEVYPGYEREVGHWDYSAGNGHWETRYTGENTYDEEGNILSEPSYEEWVLDPDWVVTAEWAPGVLEWVDDIPPQDEPVCGCCESAEITMRDAETWMPDVANVMSDSEFGNLLQRFLNSDDQAIMADGVAAMEAYGFEDPQALSVDSVSQSWIRLGVHVAKGEVHAAEGVLLSLGIRYEKEGRQLFIEVQKIHHVFFNKPSHNMMQFMGRIGLSSDQTRSALSKIQDAANANVARLALAQGKCPNFMDQPLVVDGVTLTIRGTVKVNGVVELGAVFYNP